jgi:NADPH:quinone reductase-like Zn-dependent oxidoreductase
MKAVISKKSGSPEWLELHDIEKPIPNDDEILVKIHAATVTFGDVHLRKMSFPMIWLLSLFGMPRKQIPGHELAGEVEAVGRNVNKYQPGDQVFGTTSGLKVGSSAEYVCLPVERKRGMLAKKPFNMTYQQAAAVPIGGMTARQILSQGDIQPGQDVLIYGASGSVGTYAVQLAKYYGAQVTAVCSAANFDMVRSIGAEHVIDYTQEEFTKNRQSYDVIFDAVRKISSSSSKGSLKQGGIFLSASAPTSEKNEDLIFLKELDEAGKLQAVIDRCYPLEDIVEAYRYVEQGHKKGNVVITVVEDSNL